ncbi:spore cortex-lytic protein [Paenibacillus agaridevorans]|uniref:Spore cortex-lytic enzyme n=1 Tax=Paenibacillus agaridevorans TaxID=171404 RepID=A0A2R5EMM9_9BACL|nr:spore cortex-lytic enzyme [Paenibacillus agaridevorans]GBG07920.1 spore cortex-lytic protein [Paenibacillus agaridevorans]
MINKLRIGAMVAVLFALTLGTVMQPASAAAPATLQYGSTGADVPDLQYRLKTLGYFNEGLTSYYGGVTRHSVLLFQRDYGLKADGIAGPATWKMLKKVSVNRHELDLLARIIYGEARGEPYAGQVAVGAVVMNRVAHASFPDTVKDVIEQPRAFTAVDDGQYYMKPDTTAYKAALDAVRGYDPSGGALYYFNPDTATSSWIWSRKQIGKIGRHIFAV